MNVSPSTLQRLPLRSLVEFAALCAKRVRPTFDRWPRAAKYRPAIDSAINYAERFAYNVAENPHSKSRPPVGVSTMDAAVKKAKATQAVHASFAASTAATAVLAAQIATDLVSTGYDVRLENRRSVVNIVHYAYEQMMLAAETDTEREHYANAALQDLHRLIGSDPVEALVEESPGARHNWQVLHGKGVVAHRATAGPFFFVLYGLVIGLGYGTVLSPLLPVEPVIRVLWGLAVIAVFGLISWVYCRDAEASLAQGVFFLPVLPLLVPITFLLVVLLAIITIIMVPIIRVTASSRVNNETSYDLKTVT
jgi:hypothetical protein